ncbi:MAG: ribulose-phosphate 3-epimerase [Bacilli bacterium]
MNTNVIIAPSILSADFKHLAKDIKNIEKGGAKYLHYDVMDGHFVPNISFGSAILASIKPCTKLFMDVHLMIDEPQKYYHQFALNGADSITFHYEAFKDKEGILKLIANIKNEGVKVGISIKPLTPVNDIFDFLPFIDMVLIMSVEPGFGGQKFNKNSIAKISALKKEIDRTNLKVLIEVDGGINEETAPLVVNAGADIIVLGSYIFNGNVKRNTKRICSLFSM